VRGVGLEEREGVAGLAPPPPYCALKCGEEGGLGPALLGQEAWQGKKKRRRRLRKMPCCGTARHCTTTASSKKKAL